MPIYTQGIALQSAITVISKALLQIDKNNIKDISLYLSQLCLLDFLLIKETRFQLIV